MHYRCIIMQNIITEYALVLYEKGRLINHDQSGNYRSYRLCRR